MPKYRIKCELDQEIIAEDEEEAYEKFWQQVHEALGNEELADIVAQLCLNCDKEIPTGLERCSECERIFEDAEKAKADSEITENLKESQEATENVA